MLSGVSLFTIYYVSPNIIIFFLHLLFADGRNVTILREWNKITLWKPNFYENAVFDEAIVMKKFLTSPQRLSFSQCGGKTHFPGARLVKSMPRQTLGDQFQCNILKCIQPFSQDTSVFLACFLPNCFVKFFFVFIPFLSLTL